jgi:hypothetical protein
VTSEEREVKRRREVISGRLKKVLHFFYNLWIAVDRFNETCNGKE